MKRPDLAPFLLLAAAAALCACAFQSPQELRVGVIHYQGPPPDQTLQGARLAAKVAGGEVTAGSKKVPLRLFFREVGHAPGRAEDAARSLISEDKVSVIIGPQRSVDAIPVGAIAEAAGVLYISPLSTHPLTTAGRRLAFRTGYTDDQQADALARFALEGMHFERLAVLYNRDDPHSSRVAEAFIRAIGAKGGAVVASFSYLSGNSDHTRELLSIKAMAPQALLLPNQAQEVLAQGRQGRKLGLTCSYLGGDGWWDSSIAADPAFEGSYRAAHWSPLDSRPATQEFLRLYRAETGMEPNQAAALTWDAFQVLFAAVERAGRTDPGALADALRGGEGDEGVSGRIRYAGSGDPQKPVLIVRIQEGRETPVRRFGPQGAEAP